MTKPEAGYSLLELMISLAVIGVVVLLGISGLNFARLSWERGSAISAATSDRVLTARSVRDLIGRAVLGGGALIGEPDRLALTAVMPPYTVPAGAYRVALRIDRAGPVSRLSVQRSLIGANPQSALIAGSGEPAVLYEIRGRMAFAYREGADGDGDPGADLWSERWTGADLPEVIALRIAPEGAPAWEIIAAPGVDLAARCITRAGAAERPRIEAPC